MKTFLVAVSLVFWAICPANAQNAITLQPNLKKGDKIKMTTVSYMEVPILSLETNKIESDSTILTTYFDVKEDTADKFVVATRYNVELEGVRMMSLKVKEFALHLPDFQFVVTKNGQFVQLMDEQKIITGYRTNIKKRTPDLVAYFAGLMLQNQPKDKPQKSLEELSETVFSLLANTVDEATILHLARMQAQFIFPFTEQTLELGQTKTKTAALNTTDMPFDILAQTTYSLTEIKESQAKVTLEGSANSDILMDCMVNWMKKNSDLMYNIGGNALKGGQIPDLVTLEKQIREQMKDIKLVVKNDYIFDLKTGLPISYRAQTIMSGVPKERKPKSHDIVSFELQ